MLGYDTFANKLAAVVVSGTICAAAGAAYALLFGYVGSTFASVQYSILPLLWVLLGGAATTLGPLLGTLLMYYVDRHRQRLHRPPTCCVVGVALILLVLFFPERHARHAARPVAQMAAVKPLLTTRGLSRAFGGLKAVDNVDFAVVPGEIRAIIGPNGAGKTTFVSLICGRIAADRRRRSSSTATTSPTCRRISACASASPTPSRSPASSPTCRPTTMSRSPCSAADRRQAAARRRRALRRAVNDGARAHRACRPAAQAAPAPRPMATSGCSKSRWAWR